MVQIHLERPTSSLSYVPLDSIVWVLTYTNSHVSDIMKGNLIPKKSSFDGLSPSLCTTFKNTNSIPLFLLLEKPKMYFVFQCVGQLVAYLPWMQDVGGSSPPTLTKLL